MTTARRCDFCGTAYIAQRSSSKYCSSTCRVRASAAKTSPDAEPVSEGTTRATQAALEAANRLDDPSGQAALVLARRIDQNTDNGSGMAALVREHRTTLQAALANAHENADPIDQLRTMRDAKRRRAAG